MTEPEAESPYSVLNADEIVGTLKQLPARTL